MLLAGRVERRERKVEETRHAISHGRPNGVGDKIWIGSRAISEEMLLQLGQGKLAVVFMRIIGLWTQLLYGVISQMRRSLWDEKGLG